MAKKAKINFEEGLEALEALVDRVEPVLVGFLTVCVGLTLVSVMLPLLGILGGGVM